MHARRFTRHIAPALALGATLLTAVACGESSGVISPTPDTSAVAITLLRTPAPTATDQATVILPQDVVRLRAVLADSPAAAGSRRIVASWRSSDTTVVRVASADTIASLVFPGPGNAVVTATYTDGVTTWQGAMTFRVARAQ